MGEKDKIIPLTDKENVRNKRKIIPEEIPLWKKYTLFVEEVARYF